MMLARLFGKPKQPTAIETLDTLQQKLNDLEKRSKLFEKKSLAELERAKEYTRAKNRRAAIQCLKKKKMYEEEILKLDNYQLRIHDQMIMLEGATVTVETVKALKAGGDTMKHMQKTININDVDKTLDEINEQTEIFRQIQEAVSTPVGAAADFDEDELEAELEELAMAELEEDLLKPLPAVPAPAKHVPSAREPTRPAPQKNTAEADELAVLQAEMAL